MTPAPVHAIVALSCLVVTVASLDASQLRGQGLRSVSTATLREQLQREYLTSSEAKLTEIERGLAPLYATLPKNPEGRLGHAAAAYALRRHFLREYGWLINGLAPESGGSSWDWKSSSPTSVMSGRVPAYLQQVAEENLSGKGLDLEALAVLALMLERVLMEESEGHLKESFRLAEVAVDRMVKDSDIRDALEVFMLLYITTGGKKLLGASPARFHKFRQMCENTSVTFSPLWAETRLWLHDVEQSATYVRRASDNPFIGGAQSFHGVERVVEDVHKQYSLVQHSECLDLKHTLLSMEDTRGTGRVSLARFQNSSAWGEKWQFQESKEELMALGALDVSNPAWPSVIITNYVQSPPNCLATQTLHSVCCIDECESLLAEVERGIGAPAGEPAQIARIVARLESETVDAPRNLSVALLGRLDEVAARHHGLVPLHGRLFAQWMHHAFPNECAHPLPSQWSSATASAQQDPLHKSPEDLMQELDQGDSGGRHAEDLMPWSSEEELFEESPAPHGFHMGIVHIMLLLAFLSVALGTVRSGLTAFGQAEEGLPGLQKRKV